MDKKKHKASGKGLKVSKKASKAPEKMSKASGKGFKVKKNSRGKY